MNIFDFKKSKLGMTLVEMVVSLTILGILMSATMGMIISSNTIFISTSKAALDKQVGNAVYDYIETVLRYTTHLSIYNAEGPDEPVNDAVQTLSINYPESDSGKIMYKRAGESEENRYSLYSDTFYKNRTIQYSVEKVGSKNKHVRLKVTVFRGGIARFSREAVVKCVNLGIVMTGDNPNPIKDYSSEGSKNQYLAFSVDEQLLSGGKNAYSIEHEFRDYYERYNKIQRDYTNDLKEVYNTINEQFNKTEYYDEETGSLLPFPEAKRGLKGTSYDPGEAIVDTTTKVPLSTVNNKMNALNLIIFGVSGSDEYNRDPATPEAGSLNLGIGNTNKNLRAYYQNEILKLLHFKPTNAYKTKPTNSTPGVYLQEGSFSYTPYDNNTGDEYYGVVATREEIYTGFLIERKLIAENKLNDYDSEDLIISREDYPQFENAFFENTQIGDFVGKNGDEDVMVILAYLKDNFNQDFSKLIQTSEEETVYTYHTDSALEYNEGAEKVYVSNDPLVLRDKFKNNLNHYSGVTISFDHRTHPMKDVVYVDIEDATSSVLPNNVPHRNYDKYSFTFDDSLFYNYTIDANEHLSLPTISITGGKNGFDAFDDDFRPSDKYDIKELGVDVSATIDDSSYEEIFYDTIPAVQTLWDEIIITPDVPLAEGWYAYNENSHNMHIFYLAAAPIAKTNAAGEKIAVWNGCQIRLYSKGQEIEYYSYDQAQFQTSDETIVPGNTDVTFKEFTAHQYVDFALYGADWVSWFKADASDGLFDQLISDLGGVFGTNNREDIDSIDPNDPDHPEAPTKVLGNTGSFTAGVGGIDSKARSYKMAWLLYNQKRATWYYVPTNSTSLSTSLSGTSWSSVKDVPIALDCDLDEGPWNSSAAITFSIEHRQLPSFTIFNTPKVSDAFWVSLPAEKNTIEVLS